MPYFRPVFHIKIFRMLVPVDICMFNNRIFIANCKTKLYRNDFSLDFPYKFSSMNALEYFMEFVGEVI